VVFGGVVPEVPQKFQTLGILQLVAGICNVLFGWWIGLTVWTMGGTFCSAIATLGLCPIGGLCGFVSLLILPLGFVEIVVGILMLANPQMVRSFVGWLPFFQLPALLLGDFISPIMGIVGFALTRDPEVVGYIEGM